MATVKSLQRQVTSTESKLDKASQRISMYTSRLASALAAASELLGQEVTENNYDALLCAPSDFDTWFRISDNLERLNEVKRARVKLTRRLSELQASLMELQQRESAKEATLEIALNSLSALLASFREAWYTKMVDKHRAFHARVQEALPSHALRSDRLFKCISAFGGTSGGYLLVHRRMYTALRAAHSKERVWLFQPAAVLSQEVYMTHVAHELSQSWEAGLTQLAEKCIRYDVDFSKLEVHSPAMTNLGIEVLLTDDKPRVLHVRVIWAAEYSDIVAPHTRYIITERHA